MIPLVKSRNVFHSFIACHQYYSRKILSSVKSMLPLQLKRSSCTSTYSRNCANIPDTLRSQWNDQRVICVEQRRKKAFYESALRDNTHSRWRSSLESRGSC